MRKSILECLLLLGWVIFCVVGCGKATIDPELFTSSDSSLLGATSGLNISYTAVAFHGEVQGEARFKAKGKSIQLGLEDHIFCKVGSGELVSLKKSQGSNLEIVYRGSCGSVSLGQRVGFVFEREQLGESYSSFISIPPAITLPSNSGEHSTSQERSEQNSNSSQQNGIFDFKEVLSNIGQNILNNIRIETPESRNVCRNIGNTEMKICSKLPLTGKKSNPLKTMVRPDGRLDIRWEPRDGTHTLNLSVLGLAPETPLSRVLNLKESQGRFYSLILRRGSGSDPNVVYLPQGPLTLHFILFRTHRQSLDQGLEGTIKGVRSLHYKTLDIPRDWSGQ